MGSKSPIIYNISAGSPRGSRWKPSMVFVTTDGDYRFQLDGTSVCLTVE